MRTNRLLAAAMLVAVTMPAAPTPAAAQQCLNLYKMRNLIYKRNGYCFKTAKAKRLIGNGGCTIKNQSNVKLSQAERDQVAKIIRKEKEAGCR